MKDKEITAEEVQTSGENNATPMAFKDRIPGGLLVTQDGKDEEGGIVDANSDLLKLFECDSLEELKAISQDSFFGLVYPDDIGTLRWYINVYYGELYPADSIRQKLRIRYRIQTKNGKIIPVTEAAKIVDDGTGRSLIYRTIERSEEGTMNAYKDDLTGLLTMHGFLDTIATSRRGVPFEPARYIYINLAHFKRYNMQYGFDGGNVYLCRVASILRECFGPDAVIARITADQFAVYTTATASETMKQLKMAHDRVLAIRPEATCELKAGIFEISYEQQDIPINIMGDMAKNACDAIMNAPERYFQVYDQRIADEVQMQSYIAENIDTAIQNGYIRVYYQPVVRSLTGELCGFEALSRWEDPKYGFLNPKDFITTLEENHQIHKLDLFVLEQICRQIRGEIDAGREPVPVSFNLSRVDVMMCDIFERVEAIVDRYQVARDMIRIEITESMIMKDPAQMKSVITKFRSAGYQVWMDDFGSGYSSLNMLKDFVFDELKLDMEFLRSSTPQSREIIASTVHMAKNIGIHTLAEGVETQEQVAFLRRIGCEKMQGYYYGKPAPYKESFDHVTRERHMAVESCHWSLYMDEVGLVNLQTDNALGVFFCNMTRNPALPPSRLVYANEHYEKVMDRIGCPVIGYPQEADDDPLLSRINRYICHNTWADNDPDHELVMSTTQNGQYVNFTFHQVAHAGDMRAFGVIVSELSRGEDSYPSKLDATLRNLTKYYLNIFVIHLDNDCIVPIHQDRYFRSEPGTEYHDIDAQAEGIAQEILQEDDRERFLALMDQDTILDRIDAAPHHTLRSRVRAILKDGNYHWVELSLIQAEDTLEDTVIMTCRRSFLDDNPDVAREYLRKSEN